MPDHPRICDLLLRWEEAKVEGRPLSVEELCADQPELAGALRYRIAKLEAINQLLDGPRGQTSHSTMENPGPVMPADSSEIDWQPPGFVVLGELGRGGMGVVYKAHQINLDRLVALKTIPASVVAGPRAIARFDIEARAVARLGHPNIVQIYEVGSHAGCPYIALEFMEGGSLARLLDDRHLELRRAAEIAGVLARATDYAHTRGIIHRDLKPSNVLLSRRDELDPGTIKISDFGLAKMLGEGNTSHLTQSGTTIGTPSYMAPEQAQGRAEEIGPATDVYGLGAVLYEMICGRPPFQAHSDWLTIHQVVSSPPRPIRELRPDCPPALEAICLRCLNKDPHRRYASAGALADDLKRFLEGVPVATPVIGLPTRRAWLAGTALAAVTAACTATAFHVSRRPAPIRVGVLQSQTEFMGETGQAVIDATLFAVEEVNRKGGVLGRQVVPIVADGRSDERIFAREARRLIVRDDVSALFAGLISPHRRAVEPLVEELNRLLVYPGESEGLEQSPHVVCLGLYPNQNIREAVIWCRDTLKKRRYFLVGSDSIYPHAVRAILGDEAPSLSVEIVGESYATAGDVVGWVVKTVAEIKAMRPEGMAILNLIQGKANLAFIAHLREQGITPERVPTLSFCFTEHDLRGVLTKMVGDYLCGHYFQCLDSPDNRRFLERLGREPKYGGVPVVSDAMVAAYMGVHLWAQGVERARSFDNIEALRTAMVSLRLPGPGGPVQLDPVVQCDAKYARVARVDHDRKIVIDWSSPAPVKPIAYPATRTRAQWDELIASLHARWDDHWSNRKLAATFGAS